MTSLASSSAWALVRARGPDAVPAAAPIDFGPDFALPASPNAHLVAPPGSPLPAHRTHPMLNAGPERVWEALLGAVAAMPRTWRIGQWPERRQAEWVVRTRLMNFPDLVSAQVEEMPGGSGLILYSRSLLGWSDLGANRRRSRQWFRALEAALRGG